MAGAGTVEHPAWNGLSEGLEFYRDILSALQARPPGTTVAISGTGVPADVLNGRTARQLDTASRQLTKASQKPQFRGGAKLTAPLNLVRGGFNGVGGKRVKLATIAGDGGAGLVAVEPDRGELREEGDPDPRQPKRRKSSQIRGVSLSDCLKRTVVHKLVITEKL